MRRVFAIGFALCLLVGPGCGSSEEKTASDAGLTSNDAQGTAPDQGVEPDQAIKPEKDTSTPDPDQGIADAGSDGALSPGKKCWEILTCVAACGDPACEMACFADGSPQAQGVFDTLMNCMDKAQTGACSQQCASASGDGCTACIKATCEPETSACLADGAGTSTGFGGPCNLLDAQPCGGDPDLTCFAVTDDPKSADGFCTKTCESVGDLCAGTPKGMLAGCILPVEGGGYACGFVCKVGTSSFTCPEGQACSPEASPPDSDQYGCIPATN